MMCDYGDCENDPKAGAHRVLVTISANRIDETRRKVFCSHRHASLWLKSQAERIYSEPAS